MTLCNPDSGFWELFAPGAEMLETLSASNARIKRLRKLVRDAKTRSVERVFVVEGEKAVLAALASPLVVEQIFAGHSFVPKVVQDAGHAVSSSETTTQIDCYRVADEVLASQLDSANPQLIAAVITQPTWTVDDLDAAGHVVAAVEIRDPGNLGTIMRTVEASGGAGLVIVGPSVDPFNPKVLRASAGSILRVPIVAVADLAEFASLAEQLSRTIVATLVTEEASLYDSVDLSRALLMVGNEPRGLSTDAVALAEVAVTIPTASTVESLNVAAATAVLCFEAARQARLS